VTLYFMVSVLFFLACAGFVYFTAVLVDRAIRWNDRRRERALTYRRKIQPIPVEADDETL